MQGVEILTSAQVAAEFVFNWTVFWWVAGVVLGIFLIVGIWKVITDQCDWTVIPALFVAGIIIGALGGLGLGEVTATIINHETQYKVTISDEVSMNEFYEHYEVIEQDGKIFTVREKINESN